MSEARHENGGLRPTVLVIEDDPAIRRMVRVGLGAENYRVLEAATVADGLDVASRKSPEVVLLDLSLADGTGHDVLASLREWSRVPVVILSASHEEESKVRSLDAGADDYITKPFAVSELIARVEVALRRTVMSPAANEDPIFEAAQLRVDRSARRVWVHGEEVHLTPIEYRLLASLIRQAGRVVHQEELLSTIWGRDFTGDSQYLRVYIGYLRKKIEPTEQSTRLLRTEPRVGYRLAVPA
jgi:two-component system KDP operon response regulator KdpE